LGIAANGAQVVTAAALVAELSRLAGVACPGCGASLCGHAILISIAAGLKSEPRCTACVAAVLEREPESFYRHVVSYIHHRDCYLGAWQWASTRERGCRAAACTSWDYAATDGAADGAFVAALDGETAGVAAAGALERDLRQRMTAMPVTETISHDAEWDAGDMGCGDLVLELRRRLLAMRPGQILGVVARDSGAPEDLPAWCGMTGHRLVFGNHPHYAIERRKD
jgi:tRNA 2-thiouridine synthesizing protein A